MQYQEIIDFWFQETSPELWWKKDENFDQLVKQRFLEVHQQANANELFPWRATPLGSLAEIIVLDQFSRNIYRDSAKAFASDPLALALAQRVVEKEFDLELSPVQRSFIYLPFMHSESSVIHELAVNLYEVLGEADNLAFELKHKVIIDQFGRYPHRNKILGRESTEQELAFLTQPDSSF